ncbi:MAG: MIP family channel protein [Nitrososphaeria archaeon]|jgi:aquaporin Z
MSETDHAMSEPSPVTGEPSQTKMYFAEFLGTFVYVFIGCAASLLGGNYIGTAFAFGLSYLAMAYTIGSISGCHLNPAVSISMLAAGKMKVRRAVSYVAVQCIGAIFASAMLYDIAAGNPQYNLATVGLAQNGYAEASIEGFSMLSCFIAEMVLTFILLMVFFGSTGEKAPKGFAGLSIGLSLVIINLVGIPITGASVNPARSLGPAVIVGGTALNQLWLFLAAPIIGGLLAACVWLWLEEK